MFQLLFATHPMSDMTPQSDSHKINMHRRLICRSTGIYIWITQQLFGQ